MCQGIFDGTTLTRDVELRTEGDIEVIFSFNDSRQEPLAIVPHGLEVSHDVPRDGPRRVFVRHTFLQHSSRIMPMPELDTSLGPPIESLYLSRHIDVLGLERSASIAVWRPAREAVRESSREVENGLTSVYSRSILIERDPSMSRAEGRRKRLLVVLFIPSVERDAKTAIDQDHWVDAALDLFGRVFGGATAYPGRG